jgi:hypothetical protein
MRGTALLLVAALAALAAPGPAIFPTHYLPHAGDYFRYSETTFLAGGYGDYYGYTESNYINGSMNFSATATGGNVTATYWNVDNWSNNQGASQKYPASGHFVFSAGSFLYVNGTDNQTGYVNPWVWFYVCNGFSAGSRFYLLNTPMTVESVNTTWEIPSSPARWVYVISAYGTGAYLRNDSYGTFNATYSWQAYFDPATGYVVGYVYTEQDDNGTGSGFTFTDTLWVTKTSYPLAAAPAPAAASSTPWTPLVVDAIVAVLVLVLIAIGLALWLRARRRPRLPPHSAHGNVAFAAAPPPPPPAPGAAPPPIRLSAEGQPAVQQIVMKETVKVNCRYCGALIDTTDPNCPNCGAPRT